ncbi:MAG: aldo/keto reductase [Actinobacteria bacterium]|nr:aldo/keto reductase [Actinomycetota bacterium]
MQSLVLGTAQWGDSYGVTNGAGRLGDGVLASIVGEARAAGITGVDTAAGYGDAESRLRPWAREFRITTKVKGHGATSVQDQLDLSMGRLGVDSVETVLVHDWFAMDPGEHVRVAGQLREARDAGQTDRIGISAYSQEDLSSAWDVFGSLDAVQVPVNVLDRRLVGTELVRELVSAGAHIQARSVLLQGLLAGPSTAALGGHPDVVRFLQHCADEGVSPVAAAFGYVRQQEWVDEVVVGVTSESELREIAHTWAEPLPSIDLDGLGSDDPALVDPRLWRA